jgi:hypothetical protein
MSRLVVPAMMMLSAIPVSAWQTASQGPVRPNFAGQWQLDPAKSKSEVKELVWRIDQKDTEISIEELAGGKSLCSAKCPIGKPCEFEDSGRKMGAMTYFLDKTLVQTRSASDNSTVIKRHLKMDDDGSLRVELITIVPADKTELLVFTRKDKAAADAPAPTAAVK